MILFKFIAFFLQKINVVLTFPLQRRRSPEDPQGVRGPQLRTPVLDRG